MTWLGLLAAAVAVCQIGVVVWVARQVEEIRGYRRDWQDLAAMQESHEYRIRYLHELVNPMARTGQRPWPRHLKETK